jgi:low temperature requirement protein LtrA
MRGIPLPIRTEDFTADPVELFFDLAYVFAFSQLVGLLIHDPTWGGVGEAALLFALLWLPWQQLTWAANAVSGNGRAVRTIFLAATVLSIPMAASTSSALEGGGGVFAVALTGIMLLGFGIQILAARGEPGFFKAAMTWILPNLVAIALLLAGAASHGSTRVILWLMTVAVVFGAMVLAGSGEWIIRSGHFAERHGLIIIIALGEVIVAIGVPVVASLETDSGIPGNTLAALVASGVFACLLWWGYFDRVSPSLEHRVASIEGDNKRGRYVRDVYTWAHAPMVAGIIMAAAALEEITLHPDAIVPTAFLAMMAGGLGLIAVGVTAAVWRAYRLIAWERVIGAAAVVTLVWLGSGLEGVVLLTLIVVAIALAFYIEHLRVEPT